MFLRAILVIQLLAFLATSYGEECPEGFFQCTGNETCIPDWWLCDGDDDCNDMSDEQPDNCPAYTDCPNYMWKCGNGDCVLIEDICDGYEDCEDGSDEHDPETGTCPDCPEHWVSCTNSSGCIYELWKCDGDNDCGDWSDETEEACPCTDGFRCSKDPSDESPTPGVCIPSEYVCDEENFLDCPNGDDQTNCTVQSGEENGNGIRKSSQVRETGHVKNKKSNHSRRKSKH